ncbi:MAG: 30S ribosomal protein S6 [candidate division WOR-3 bacterium]
MNVYESVLIVSGKLSQETVEELANEFKNLFLTCGVQEPEITKIEKKRFAHPIRKIDEGYYLFIRFSALPESLKKIEENLRHNEKILRSAFLKVEGALKG